MQSVFLVGDSRHLPTIHSTLPTGQYALLLIQRWYCKYFKEDNDAGGPVESFYDSFNPSAQRRNLLPALGCLD